MSQFKGFTSVELNRPKRSKFDLSHERRMTMRMGQLVPCFVSETIPDDTFRISTEVMLRLAPLLAPIMHRVNVFVHFFFVPYRRLWEGWENFIVGGRLGTETVTIPPYFKINGVLAENLDYFDKGSLADYLGIPNIPDADVALWTDRKIDALPFLAYTKIWNDYYRDQNFEADLEGRVGSGLKYLPIEEGVTEISGDFDKYLTLLYRKWQHDYFTSALPWTQRGDEVLMPLQGTGTVTYLKPSKARLVAGDTLIASGDIVTDAGGDLQNIVLPNVGELYIENIDEVELTSSDVSINDLRTALALQKWLERNALAGSRYNESIMAHFGKRTSDGRMQRAEYLGGGKVVVKISEVVTTAFSEDADTNVIPPASMTGHGMVIDNASKVNYNCEEHGIIMGIMSVMPTSAYQQGIPRMFVQRNTYLDYPWPTFAHLGEQEVYKSEIFLNPTNLPIDRTAQPVFGYQSRYCDWKHISSSNHGDFRDTLEFWTLTRKFATSPVLSAEFVTFEDTLQDRVFAVTGVDTLWIYIYNKCSVIRSLPYFGTPRL